MRTSRSTRFSAIIDDRQPGRAGREADEPTDRLGLEAINALNIALQRYEGTVLLITHDHHPIDEGATRLWHLGEHGIEDFHGSYEGWKGKHS
jgi:ATPase subunit of ABC transporter with duplicated ATPase domains